MYLNKLIKNRLLLNIKSNNLLFNINKSYLSIQINKITNKMEFSSLLQANELIEFMNNDLNKELNKKIKFIDASYHMDKNRNAQKEYLDEHLINAIYFDIDKICDKNTSLPHMLPSEEFFNNTMNSMNIYNDDIIIIYGTKNALAPCRVWWTFKIFGHKNVSIIDGGLEEWKKANGKTTSGEVNIIPNNNNNNNNNNGYHSIKNNNLVVSCEEVLLTVNKGDAQIVDARSLGRFRGELPEPREGLKGGCIPGSLCVPFTNIVTTDNYTKFKSINEIRNIFRDNGVILGSKIILSCGSGVTASILHFGLHLIGMKPENTPVYDGSWTEWGSTDKTDLPIINQYELEKKIIK